MLSITTMRRDVSMADRNRLGLVHAERDLGQGNFAERRPRGARHRRVQGAVPQVERNLAGQGEAAEEPQAVEPQAPWLVGGPGVVVLGRRGIAAVGVGRAGRRCRRVHEERAVEERALTLRRFDDQALALGERDAGGA
jgi:hypothetical protein